MGALRPPRDPMEILPHERTSGEDIAARVAAMVFLVAGILGVGVLFWFLATGLGRQAEEHPQSSQDFTDQQNYIRDRALEADRIQNTPDK